MADGKSCCAPARDGNGNGESVPDVARSDNAGSREGMVLIEQESFLMGDDGPEAWPADGEGPVREVRLAPYYIDRTAVTREACQHRFCKAQFWGIPPGRDIFHGV